MTGVKKSKHSFLIMNFQFKVSESFAVILQKSIVIQFTKLSVGIKCWLYSPLTVTRETHPLARACSWEPQWQYAPGCGPAQGLGGLVAPAVQGFGEKSIFFWLNFSKLCKEWKWSLGRSLRAVFVNVSTDPSIKVHPILDLAAVVYNSQFQFYLMPFSLIWIKLVLSCVLIPW